MYVRLRKKGYFRWDLNVHAIGILKSSNFSCSKNEPTIEKILLIQVGQNLTKFMVVSIRTTVIRGERSHNNCVIGSSIPDLFSRLRSVKTFYSARIIIKSFC